MIKFKKTCLIFLMVQSVVPIMAYPPLVYVWDVPGDNGQLWFFDKANLLLKVHSMGPVSNLATINKETATTLSFGVPVGQYKFPAKMLSDQFYSDPGSNYNSEAALITSMIDDSTKKVTSMKPITSWRVDSIYSPESEVDLSRDYDEQYADGTHQHQTINQTIIYSCDNTSKDKLYTGEFAVSNTNGICTNQSPLDLTAAIKSTNHCSKVDSSGACICNNTNDVIAIAKSFPDMTPSSHAGWFLLQHGECRDFGDTSQYFAISFDEHKAWSSSDGVPGSINDIITDTGPACAKLFKTGNENDFYSSGCASRWKSVGDSESITDGGSNVEGIIVNYTPITGGSTILLTDATAHSIFDKQNEHIGKRCSLSADPIDLSSGDLYESAIDYETATPYPLTVTRYYNSQPNPIVSPIFGKGWTGILSVYLSIQGDSIYLHKKNGRVSGFQKINGSWKNISGNEDQLFFDQNQYQVKLGSGIKYSFSSIGVLLRSTNRHGLKHEFLWDSNGDVSIRDDFNHKLVFHIADNHIQSVTLPSGSKITYKYDSEESNGTNLIEVDYPDGKKTYYTYQIFSNPVDVLTSKSHVLNTPASSWTYSDNGLVNSNTENQ